MHCTGDSGNRRLRTNDTRDDHDRTGICNFVITIARLNRVFPWNPRHGRAGEHQRTREANGRNERRWYRLRSVLTAEMLWRRTHTGGEGVTDHGVNACVRRKTGITSVLHGTGARRRSFSVRTRSLNACIKLVLHYTQASCKVVATAKSEACILKLRLAVATSLQSTCI